MRGLLKGVLLAASVVSTALAAEPQLAGSWKLTFYLEPGHTLGASQCLVFTKQGNQVGEPNSGTWTSPTFPGWTGEWFQDKGDHFQFYGFTSGGLATSAYGALVSNNIAAGEFNHFTPGVTSSAGAILLNRVHSCTTSPLAPNGSDDPSSRELVSPALYSEPVSARANQQDHPTPAGAHRDDAVLAAVVRHDRK
jgi:hypothetical protein